MVQPRLQTTTLIIEKAGLLGIRLGRAQLPFPPLACIIKLEPGKVAESSGLRIGDLIIRVNGCNVGSDAAAAQWLKAAPDGTIRLQVLRHATTQDGTGRGSVRPAQSAASSSPAASRRHTVPRGGFSSPRSPPSKPAHSHGPRASASRLSKDGSNDARASMGIDADDASPPVSPLHLPSTRPARTLVNSTRSTPVRSSSSHSTRSPPQPSRTTLHQGQQPTLQHSVVLGCSARLATSSPAIEPRRQQPSPSSVPNATRSTPARSTPARSTPARVMGRFTMPRGGYTAGHVAGLVNSAPKRGQGNPRRSELSQGALVEGLLSERRQQRRGVFRGARCCCRVPLTSLTSLSLLEPLLTAVLPPGCTSLVPCKVWIGFGLGCTWHVAARRPLRTASRVRMQATPRAVWWAAGAARAVGVEC